jgi:hypothetical protein
MFQISQNLIFHYRNLKRYAYQNLPYFRSKVKALSGKYKNIF